MTINFQALNAQSTVKFREIIQHLIDAGYRVDRDIETIQISW